MPEKRALKPGSTLVEISDHPLAVIAALDAKPSIGGYIITSPAEEQNLLLNRLRMATHKPVICNLAIPDRCNIRSAYKPDRQLLENCHDLGLDGVLIQASCLPEPRALDLRLIETIQDFDLTPWIDLRMRGCVLTRSPFQALQSAFDHPENNLRDFIVRPKGQKSMRNYLEFLQKLNADYEQLGSEPIAFRLYVDSTTERQARVSTTAMNAVLGSRWHHIMPSRLLV